MNSVDCEDYRVAETPGGKGLGLFAARPFAAGEPIYRLDYWSEPWMPMHATNHRCDPNAAFDADGMLVALREITEGEEITYDYRTVPLPASPWNFACLCGSANCVGWLNMTEKKN